MLETTLYPTIKHVHLLAITASVSLFSARWLGVLAGRVWPMSVTVRHTSVAIDSVLLLAGVMLWHLGNWSLPGSLWLVTKWGLLLVYVLLGSWALKRAATPLGHGLCGLLALVTVGQMVGVALHHHPAGWLIHWLDTGTPR